MMRIAKSIAVGLATFCAIYLAGAFAAADFNIARWDWAGRVLIAYVGAAAAFVAAYACWEQSHA